MKASEANALARAATPETVLMHTLSIIQLSAHSGRFEMEITGVDRDVWDYLVFKLNELGYGLLSKEKGRLKINW